MEIPNYDSYEDENTNFKKLYSYMPDKPTNLLNQPVKPEC